VEAGERHAKRARARIVAVSAVALASSILVAIGPACLPELAPLGGAGDGGPPAKVRGCGDGIIATLDDGGDAGESCDPGEAGVKGCTSDCRIACENDAGIDPATGHCYFVAGTESSGPRADDLCQRSGAHLVTFASEDETRLVDAFADRTMGYWVGLFQNPRAQGYTAARTEEPGFPTPPVSGPCPGCFGVGANDAGVFPRSPLFDPNAVAACVVAASDGWQLVPCVAAPREFQVVCEREPAGRRIDSCSGGFCFTLAATSKEGKSYVLDVASSTADQAAVACAQYGARPVVLGSREEREALAHEILQLFTPDPELTYWIGASQDGGAWTWENGDPIVEGAPRPLPWGDKQPSAGVRAYMRLTAGAYDTQLAYAGAADEKRPTLCERRSR
jgi:hypothetical protein